MIAHLLAAALVARTILLAGQSPPDPCALVSPTEIAAALGVQPASGTPHGPEVDKETGARAWSCDHKVGDAYLSIGFAEFPTAAGAAAGVGEMAKMAAEDLDEFKMSPQGGLGDGALWGSTDDGAIWVVHKGKYMVNVTLGGNLGDNARLRDSFKRLASLALAKL